MLHYHGTPITPRDRQYELAGRNFCVPFADPRDVVIAHEIGQSVMLHNGAFSCWTRGIVPEWGAYYQWARPWLDYPTTWAVIPDVIDGDEDANDDLLIEWARTRLPKGAPVWHLHESLDRLVYLTRHYDRVCFGSSGAYRDPGTDRWHRRIAEAFDAVADEDGRVPWIHMLRAMDEATKGRYPFASADSTNAARNHAGSHRRRSRPIAKIAAEIDSRQAPGRWRPVGVQTRMEVA